MLDKIINAGQTPTDRCALDWAIENGISHAGWCPKGTLAQDGPIPAEYKLKETPTNSPLQGNEWNVWDAEGVVVVTMNAELSGYSRDTVELAEKHHKPFLHLRIERHTAARRLHEFVENNHIHSLYLTCCQTAESQEMIAMLPLVLTDALLRSFEEPSKGHRQNGEPTVAKPGVQPSTHALIPDRITPEDEDAPLSESQILAMYRSFEGSEEYAAKLRPMLRNPSIPADTDEFHMASGLANMTQSNPAEAARQLEQISDGMREYPIIMLFLLYAYMGTGNWPKLTQAAQVYTQHQPEKYFGWVFWAIALDKTGRTKEAHALLLSVLDRFEATFTFPYNLACFACKLGNQEEAWAWVLKAFRLTTLEQFKLWLLSDEDLKPLRNRILELSQTQLI